MIDWNIIIGAIIVFGLFAFLIYVTPFLKKKDFDYYEELELALLVCGYAFREDKMKLICQIALEVVQDLEELSLLPSEKHYAGIKNLSIKLLDQLNIQLPEDVLNVIIRVAVKTLPPTNN